MRIISKQRHLTSGVYIPDKFREHLNKFPGEIWDVYFLPHPLVVIHIYDKSISSDPIAAVQDDSLLGALEAALNLKGRWRAPINVGQEFRLKVTEVPA